MKVSCVPSAFNPTPLNQRGAGGCLNQHPQSPGKQCFAQAKQQQKILLLALGFDPATFWLLSQRSDH
jgi:hypothetical protein